MTYEFGRALRPEEIAAIEHQARRMRAALFAEFGRAAARVVRRLFARGEATGRAARV